MLERREFLAAVVGSAAPVTSTPLVGAWSLIDAVTIEPDGRSRPWNGWGPSSIGLILYEPTGLMAVQIAGPRSRQPHETEFSKLPADQRLDYLRTYYAYFGRYTFDAAQSIVTHVISSSLDPSEIGDTYRRKVDLHGDMVTLTTLDPNGPHSVLRWRRVAS